MSCILAYYSFVVSDILQENSVRITQILRLFLGNLLCRYNFLQSFAIRVFDALVLFSMDLYYQLFSNLRSSAKFLRTIPLDIGFEPACFVLFKRLTEGKPTFLLHQSFYMKKQQVHFYMMIYHVIARDL